MRTLSLLSALLVAVSVCAFTPSAPLSPAPVAPPDDSLAADAHTVTVTVWDIESPKGAVRLGLFEESPTFPYDRDAAIRYETRDVTAATVNQDTLRQDDLSMTFTFEDVPPGTYAVAVHHDRDDDREIDRNVLGAPNEGCAFSNDAWTAFEAPPFDHAAFTVRADTTLRTRIVD